MQPKRRWPGWETLLDPSDSLLETCLLRAWFLVCGAVQNKQNFQEVGHGEVNTSPGDALKYFLGP